MKDNRLILAKKRSIVGYLRSKGYFPEKRGRGYTMMSPFKEERNPSFFIYESQGRFIDYSTGEMGDIVDLAIMLEKLPWQMAVDSILSDNGLVNVNIQKAPKPRRLNLKTYIQRNKKEVRRIHQYAMSRGIRRGNYYAGNVPIWDNKTEKMVKKSAMLFPHRDENLRITGFKARMIFTDEARFTARGRLGFYYLKTRKGFGKERLYIVESETSANSLCNFLEEIDVNATILCFGGVNQTNKIKIPDRFCNLLYKFLVIDYDGDEKLYQERLKNFEHLNLRDVKIEVKKGEDINSLYMNGMIGNYIHQILGNEY